jgi:myo-inositol 2-dehydrogenase/D-chiro-inositol 1-dehydrogenase
MITGWGQHHYDIAAWGMDTEHTGPISVEAVAQFPKSGDWNVHGDFMVKQEYENGASVYTSGGYPNGVRFEGEKGWVFVTRGAYRATPSDPIPKGNTKALVASSDEIFNSVIGKDETKLYVSKEQHGNWLDCIKSRKAPISPAEISHRTCSVCLISDIAMQIPGVLKWNPDTERFTNDDEANTMLSRSQRLPYGVNNIKGI